MKNIHILPSRFPKGIHFLDYHITSDEKIKEGEYGLSKLNEIVKFHSGYDYRYYAKIILTTDQDLIKDGVQAIPDEFLEWFVKNPSCDEVEVFHQDVYSMGKWDRRYKIIIPKEEPKQDEDMSTLETQYKNFLKDNPNTKMYFEEWEKVNARLIKQAIINMMKADEELELYDEPFKHKVEAIPAEEILANRSNAYEFIDFNKQETVEEYFLDNIKNMLQFKNDALAMRFMEKYYHAKKQQERGYSEEELIQTLIKFNQEIHEVEDVREWFKKIKNK